MIIRTLCRLVGHRRSARNAHQVNGAWHSRCKRCGAKLVRLSPCEWRESSDAA